MTRDMKWRTKTEIKICMSFVYLPRQIRQLAWKSWSLNRSVSPEHTFMHRAQRTPDSLSENSSTFCKEDRSKGTTLYFQNHVDFSTLKNFTSRLQCIKLHTHWCSRGSILAQGKSCVFLWHNKLLLNKDSMH